MKNSKWLSTIILTTITVMPGLAHSSWADKQKGFAIVPTNRESLCSENFFQTVRHLQAIGANLVTIRVPWSQQKLNDSVLYRYQRTPNDDALHCAIEFVQSQGMEFALHLVVNVPGWRADIDPLDRDLWFRSMGDIAIKYAGEFAEVHGANHISVGTEMYKVVSNIYTSENAAGPGRYRWPEIIADVRTNYSGPVTYSAQHSGDRSAVFEDNDLLEHLDVISFSGYWPLYATNKQSLLLEWDRIERETITPALNRYGKQIALSEVGYRPCSFTFERPYDSWTECPYDDRAQALAWDALLTNFADKPYFNGVTGGWYWNNDPTVGGVGDIDYTPHGKMAGDVLAQYWTSDVVPTDAVPPATTPEPEPEPEPEPPTEPDPFNSENPPTEPESNEGPVVGTNGSGGASGGCSLIRGAKPGFDPVLLLLILVSMSWLGRSKFGKS